VNDWFLSPHWFNVNHILLGGSDFVQSVLVLASS
jgi:hypothetical protein